MEESITNLELSTQEMMAALAVGGLWPTVTSPLMASLQEALWEAWGAEDGEWQPSHAGLAGLKEKGVMADVDSTQLEKSCQKALSTLVDPKTNIITCFGTADTVGVARYFSRSDGGDDGLVLYQQQDTAMHLLSFFHSPLGLLEIADQYVGFAPPPSVPELAVEVSFKEYVVLLGLMDAQRTRYLEAMLRRQPPSVWEFTAQEVKAMLRQGQEHHDIRWLVPLLEITSPLPMEVGDEEIGPLLEQFSSRGYLIPSDEKPSAYRFSPDLHDLVQSFFTLVSFFYFGIGLWQADVDVWVNTHFVAFRGLLTLWVVDYLDLESPAPAVNICSMSYDELREAMTELLLGPETEVEAQMCASCGAPLKPGKKFCTQCGAPLG